MSQGIEKRTIINALQGNGLFCPYCGSDFLQFVYAENTNFADNKIRDLKQILCMECDNRVNVIEDDELVDNGQSEMYGVDWEWGDYTYAAPPVISKFEAMELIKDRYKKSSFINRIKEDDFNLVFIPYMSFKGKVKAIWNIICNYEVTNKHLFSQNEISYGRNVFGEGKDEVYTDGPFVSPFAKSNKTENIGKLDGARFVKVYKDDLNILPNTKITSMQSDEYMYRICVPSVEEEIGEGSYEKEKTSGLFEDSESSKYNLLKSIDYNHEDMKIVFFPLWYCKKGNQYVSLNAYTLGLEGKFDTGNPIIDVVNNLMGIGLIKKLVSFTCKLTAKTVRVILMILAGIGGIYMLYNILKWLNIL